VVWRQVPVRTLSRPPGRRRRPFVRSCCSLARAGSVLARHITLFLEWKTTISMSARELMRPSIFKCIAIVTTPQRISDHGIEFVTYKSPFGTSVRATHDDMITGLGTTSVGRLLIDSRCNLRCILEHVNLVPKFPPWLKCLKSFEYGYKTIAVFSKTIDQSNWGSWWRQPGQ
jgi:hypothetical protein